MEELLVEIADLVTAGVGHVPTSAYVREVPVYRFHAAPVSVLMSCNDTAVTLSVDAGAGTTCTASFSNPPATMVAAAIIDALL